MLAESSGTEDLLTLILLKLDMSCLANNVDPDQLASSDKLASEEAN